MTSVKYPREANATVLYIQDDTHVFGYRPGHLQYVQLNVSYYSCGLLDALSKLPLLQLRFALNIDNVSLLPNSGLLRVLTLVCSLHGSQVKSRCDTP